MSQETKEQSVRKCLDIIGSKLRGSSFKCHVNDALDALEYLYLEADILLSPTELREVYDYEHRRYQRENWVSSVKDNDTILGYWEWVHHKLIEDC